MVITVAVMMTGDFEDKDDDYDDAPVKIDETQLST